MLPNQSCAFTGHRPLRFSFGHNETDEACIQLKETIAALVHRLVQANITCFYTGMAQGTDQWCAEAVLDIKKTRPDVQLIAVCPCATQDRYWSGQQQWRYRNLLKRCDDVVTMHPRYTNECMHERNRWMVNRAFYLLAVYDGTTRGGTADTVEYAKERDRAIVIIHPDTLTLHSNRVRR